MADVMPAVTRIQTPLAVMPAIMAVGSTICTVVLPCVILVSLSMGPYVIGPYVKVVTAMPAMSVFGLLASYLALATVLSDKARLKSIGGVSLVGVWGGVVAMAAWFCWILGWLV